MWIKMCYVHSTVCIQSNPGLLGGSISSIAATRQGHTEETWGLEREMRYHQRCCLGQTKDGTTGPVILLVNGHSQTLDRRERRRAREREREWKKITNIKSFSFWVLHLCFYMFLPITWPKAIANSGVQGLESYWEQFFEPWIGKMFVFSHPCCSVWTTSCSIIFVYIAFNTCSVCLKMFSR